MATANHKPKLPLLIIWKQFSTKKTKKWNWVQHVVYTYACVVYIISYMSNAARETGLLLINAHREASKDGNISAKEAYTGIYHIKSC